MPECAIDVCCADEWQYFGSECFGVFYEEALYNTPLTIVTLTISCLVKLWRVVLSLASGVAPGLSANMVTNTNDTAHQAAPLHAGFITDDSSCFDWQPWSLPILAAYNWINAVYLHKTQVIASQGLLQHALTFNLQHNSAAAAATTDPSARVSNVNEESGVDQPAPPHGTAVRQVAAASHALTDKQGVTASHALTDKQGVTVSHALTEKQGVAAQQGDVQQIDLLKAHRKRPCSF